jgi:hypothetical protein
VHHLCVDLPLSIHIFQILRPIRFNEIFPLEQTTEAYEQMMSGKAPFRAVLQQDISDQPLFVRCHKNIMKCHPLSLRSSNRYIEKDPEFNCMVNYQSWKKELNTKSRKQKTKCTRHNKVYTESLWTEIEALNWVLNEILMLSRKE